MATSVLDASTYLDVSLRECGREVCIAGKHIRFTPKNYALIHYVYAGMGTFVYGGKSYRLRAGDCFLIPANNDADYHPDPENPWSYFWIGLGGSKVASLCEQSGFSADNPVVHDYGKAYRVHFDAIYDAYFGEGKFGLDCLAHAYLLFNEMSQDHAEKEPMDKGERGHIQAAKAYIRNNFQFPITILDVASSVGVSPNYLANLFAKEGEPSPKRYLIQTRMETAAELLRGTDSSIGDIARLVGYLSPLHFSKSFSAYHGCSPLHYRTQQGDH